MNLHMNEEDSRRVQNDPRFHGGIDDALSTPPLKTPIIAGFEPPHGKRMTGRITHVVTDADDNALLARFETDEGVVRWGFEDEFVTFEIVPTGELF